MKINRKYYTPGVCYFQFSYCPSFIFYFLKVFAWTLKYMKLRANNNNKRNWLVNFHKPLRCVSRLKATSTSLINKTLLIKWFFQTTHDSPKTFPQNMFEVVAHEKALYGLLDQMKTYWKTILDSYCFFFY